LLGLDEREARKAADDGWDVASLKIDSFEQTSLHSKFQAG
jgi:hypothetical protein